MRSHDWRLYLHPATAWLVWVHPNDTGMAVVYERWGWREIG